MSVIRRNIFWLLVSQAATWVATLVALLIVPNKLGSTDLGTFGFATGYVQFFALFAGLGTATYLSREIARDPTIFGSYVWNAVLLKVALWAVLSAAAIGLAVALGNRGETLAIIAIGCAGMLPGLLAETFGGALIGLQRMARPAMWAVCQVYFQTIFGVVVLLLGGGVVLFAAITTLGTLIPFAGNGMMAAPFFKGNRSFDFGIWRSLVVGGIPLLVLAFLTLISGTLDVPILHSLVGSEPVGWYVVALRWVGIPVFITTAVVGAHFPAFSQHGKPLTDHFAPLVNRSLHIVLLVTVPASVGLMFVSSDLIHLVYDHGYDESIVLMQILAVGIPLISMDTVLGTALVASNRLNKYLIVALSAAIMNPIACFVTIKFTQSRYDNGAIGASLATVATELWIMVGALLLKTPGVLDRAEVVRTVRIVAASALMVPVLLVSIGWPLAMRVILGAAAYAVGSLLFGTVSIAELRALPHQMLSSRRGKELGEPPDSGDVLLETNVGPLAVPVVPPSADEEPSARP